MLDIHYVYQSSQTIEQWLGESVKEPGSMSSVFNTRWTICMMTCWDIWKARRRSMFEDKVLNPGVTIMEIRASSEELMRLSNQRRATQRIPVGGR